MPHMSLICHKKDIIYLQIQTRFEYNKFIGNTQSVPSLKDSPAEKTSAPHTVNGAAAVIIADKKTAVKIF